MKARSISVLQLVVAIFLGLMLIGQVSVYLRKTQPAATRPRLPAAAGGGRDAAGKSEPQSNRANNALTPRAKSPACDSWDCLSPKQGPGAVAAVGGVELESPPVPVTRTTKAQQALGAAPGDKAAAAASDVDERTPQHCSEQAGISHTGVDYFCCNRARGEAELAAVSTASMADFIATGGRFPVMAVTYDRAAVLDKTLASLLAVRCVQRGDVFVIQDGAIAAVKGVIDKHGVRGHQKTDAQAMRGGKPTDGAERIAQHFGYALRHMFEVAAPRAPAVIVVEDDFLFSPDFYEYFHAVAPALEADASLWLASAWNDNGFDYLVADPYALKRTRFFPGLGWLLPRRVWEEELASSWPHSHWDHWMRDPARHKGRDIVIPEVNRDYHAGVKGTFMDTQTHNRYFGSIAMQADPAFTWDTPQGSDAINRVLQPAYDTRLAATLRDPSTVHLADVEAIRRFSEGVGVVWYECPTNVHNHDQMRGIAAFFGIWHEGGRGSREGVHEIWWLGSARLILINACDEAVSGGGGVYVTGSIACSPLRTLMPPGRRPIPWSAFQTAGERPHLPRHTALFGAVLDTPLAHMEGGHDANGPPDVPAPGSAGGEGAAGGRGARESGGHGHEGGEGGEGHPHAHKRFMGDLVLPARHAAAVPGAEVGGPGGHAFLPASVRVVRSTKPGLSCTQVCAQYRPDAICSSTHLPAINDCATLSAHFDCSSCTDSTGRDQPAMIDRSAPADKLPGKCLVNGDRSLFSCDGSYPFALRLCPCAV